MVGQTVALIGLTTRPDLEGAISAVVSLDVAAGRVAVQVSATSEFIKVKPCNIKLFGRKL